MNGITSINDIKDHIRNKHSFTRFGVVEAIMAKTGLPRTKKMEAFASRLIRKAKDEKIITNIEVWGVWHNGQHRGHYNRFLGVKNE